MQKIGLLLFLSGVSQMRDPLKTICLTSGAILAIGAYLLAQGGRPSRETLSTPTVLAMQQPQAGAQEDGSGSPLRKLGWIGVSLEDAKGPEIRVKDVFPGGPAAFAGVRVGDVLLKIGGVNVDSRGTAEAAIERAIPGRQTSLTIRRKEKSIELKITPDSLADFREHYVGEMLRRDPRDSKYGQRHGVSAADMHVELIRRLFEQHQRMELSLHELTQEVQALRREVRALQK
jgi:membrane-associated protease RseP (regulator of RpoE activity)